MEMGGKVVQKSYQHSIVTKATPEIIQLLIWHNCFMENKKIYKYILPVFMELHKSIENVIGTDCDWNSKVTDVQDDRITLK